MHEEDGYPRQLPPDVEAWMTSERARSSWVATLGDQVVGQVSRAVAEGDQAAPLWCRATGRSIEELAVVKRLFVDPSTRGRGIGRRLLDTVLDDAHRLGLHPVLDVDVRSVGARRMYEGAGFAYIGDAELAWSHGGVFVAACYVGPPSPPALRSEPAGR